MFWCSIHHCGSNSQSNTLFNSFLNTFTLCCTWRLWSLIALTLQLSMKAHTNAHTSSSCRSVLDALSHATHSSAAWLLALTCCSVCICQTVRCVEASDNPNNTNQTADTRLTNIHMHTALRLSGASSTGLHCIYVKFISIDGKFNGTPVHSSPRKFSLIPFDSVHFSSMQFNAFSSILSL